MQDMPQAFQVPPPISLTVYSTTLRGGSHALELKVVAHFHAWLDEAVTVLDADALVTEGHVGRHNHLHLRASLPWGNAGGVMDDISNAGTVIVSYQQEERWRQNA